MSALAEKIFALIIAALVIGAGLFYIKDLRAELALASQATQRALSDSAGKDQVIKQMQTDQKEASLAYIKLQDDRDNIRQTLTEREQQFRRLQYEDKNVHDWAAGAVPDSVIGLLDHPAYTSAADYQQAHADGNAVHTAGGSDQK